MTDFHDLHLKEQQLLQQKWEECVDVNEGDVCDLCVIVCVPAMSFGDPPDSKGDVAFLPKCGSCCHWSSTPRDERWGALGQH